MSHDYNRYSLCNVRARPPAIVPVGPRDISKLLTCPEVTSVGECESCVTQGGVKNHCAGSVVDASKNTTKSVTPETLGPPNVQTMNRT